MQKWGRAASHPDQEGDRDNQQTEAARQDKQEEIVHRKLAIALASVRINRHAACTGLLPSQLTRSALDGRWAQRTTHRFRSAGANRGPDRNSTSGLAAAVLSAVLK